MAVLQIVAGDGADPADQRHLRRRPGAGPRPGHRPVPEPELLRAVRGPRRGARAGHRRRGAAHRVASRSCACRSWASRCSPPCRAARSRRPARACWCGCGTGTGSWRRSPLSPRSSSASSSRRSSSAPGSGRPTASAAAVGAGGPVRERRAAPRVGRRRARPLFLLDPLLGVGFGQYEYVSPRFVGNSFATSAHNQYLKILAEQGLVGTAFYVAAVVALLVAMRRSALALAPDGDRDARRVRRVGAVPRAADHVPDVGRPVAGAGHRRGRPTGRAGRARRRAAGLRAAVRPASSPAARRRSEHVRHRGHRSGRRPAPRRRAPRRRDARGRIAHRGPDEQRVFADVARGDRVAPPVDHRPRHRQPAAGQRGRVDPGQPERRDLQLRRAARGAAAARPHAPDGRRHRDDRPPVRGVRRRRSSSTCAGCSRSRSGTPAGERLVLARDRLGKKPIYWRPARRPAALGLGAQGAARRPDASRARSTASRSARYLQYQYIPAPGHDPRGRPQAASRRRSSPGRAASPRSARYWEPAYEPEGEPHRSRRIARPGCDLLREAVRLRLRSDVPVGLFLSGGMDSTHRPRADGRGLGAAGADVHDRLRGRRVRRAAVRAGRRRRTSATEHTEEVVRLDVIGMLPGLAEHLRRAVRRLLGHPDLPRRAGRRAARPGRADRRRRRRDVRGLRPLPRRARAQPARGPAEAGPPRARARARRRRGGSRARPSRAATPTRRSPRPSACPRTSSTCGGLSQSDLRLRSRLHGRRPGRRPGRVPARRARGGPVGPARPDAAPRTRSPTCPRTCSSRWTERRWPTRSRPGRRCSTTSWSSSRRRLPAQRKMQAGTTKVLLREIAGTLLPPSLLDRPKYGFAAPLEGWFRSELAGVYRDVVLAPDACLRDHLDQDVAAADAGRAPRGTRGPIAQDVAAAGVRAVGAAVAG